MRRTAASPFLLAALAVLAPACIGDSPPDEGEPESAGVPGAAEAGSEGRLFERRIVFTATERDSTLIVPWFFDAFAREEGVTRRVRGWLGRGGSWESFFEDVWEGPPNRAPWRILPRDGVRLVVGPGDALESVIFREGPRRLAVDLGATLADFAGQHGETYRIHEATASLAAEEVVGAVLDLGRSRLPGAAPPGDWAFLTSGDSLYVVLAAPEAAPSGTPGAFRGWARVEFREEQWPGVTVEWTETRAFEPARREVPVAWSLVSEEGGLEGELRLRPADLSAGEGEGPLLPVDALFQAEGTLRIGRADYPVRGLVRHLQE